MVYWNPADVWLALIGGGIIGVSTTLHLLLRGRVTGFSGIFFSLVTFDKSSFLWKLCLIMAVILISGIMFLIYGFTDPIWISSASSGYDPPEVMLGQAGLFGLAVAGFCVGLGTKMGNGCTSGHGVCGLPRFSIRSSIAVACFMVSGIMTATVKYYIYIPSDASVTIGVKFLQNSSRDAALSVVVISSAIILGSAVVQYVKDRKQMIDILVGILVGGLFGLGLVVSGMVKRSKISGFLTINNNWDPSLAFVMVGAVVFNTVTFNYIIHCMKKPIFNLSLQVPNNKTVDWKLIVGEGLFGIGWGIGDLCPGPAFALIPPLSFEIVIFFFLSLTLGQYSAYYVDKLTQKNKNNIVPSEKIQVVAPEKNENTGLIINELDKFTQISPQK